MEGLRTLRWRVVVKPRKEKPLHARLQALLQERWKAGAFDQVSLAKAIGKDQTTVGQYLRNGKAGPLDLDEAAAALEHIGSSLADFIAALPPRDLSAADILCREVVGREDVIPAVKALLAVPRKRLHGVLLQIENGVFVATGRTVRLTAESETETTPASRTKSVPRRRR